MSALLVVHLDRTIADLRELGPSIRSLSIVPVGLTRFNIDRPVRLLHPNEAAAVIDQVDKAREWAVTERGSGWCYAADEMYLIAGRTIPGGDYYDDGALYENGVGAVRRFLDSFDQGIAETPRYEGVRIRLVTGGSMLPFINELAPRLSEQTGAEVNPVHVLNRYFGDTVTIAGLLGGEDILHALGECREDDVIVLPAEALNADGVFIDDVTLEDFKGRVGGACVLSGYQITDALKGISQ